jgi:DNA invertase Pin-like site-specific DNA recombinase
MPLVSTSTLSVGGVDISTPVGRALFQMLGVFAEFERAPIQDRIRASIANAQG